MNEKTQADKACDAYFDTPYAATSGAYYADRIVFYAGFAAGATSRDAEIAELVAALDNSIFVFDLDPKIAKALAATADLENVRLCEKEPVARAGVREDGSLVLWSSPTTVDFVPLYRAWEPK